MIQVTKLNGEVFYINPREIEFIEETPDTVLSLISGKKVLVAEDAEEVIRRVVAFYRLTGRTITVLRRPRRRPAGNEPAGKAEG